MLPWLRRCARHGAHIGATGAGTLILAQAGLLEGFQSTTHWEAVGGLQEEFPQLAVSKTLYVIDRTRFTCTGGVAVADLFLYEVMQRHGQHLATAVADRILHERIRDGQERPRGLAQLRRASWNSKLIQIVEDMELHIEEPLPMGEFARRTGLTPRQVQRLFRQKMKMSPAQYYRKLRLDHARRLLRQTTKSIMEVSTASGFRSLSHFSAIYRNAFGRAPRSDRVRSPIAR